MGWRRGLVAAAAMLAVSHVARAHALVGGETVNGGAQVVVDRSPATLEVTVTNVRPSAASTAQTLAAPLPVTRGFAFAPAASFTLGVSGAASTTFELALQSEQDRLAAGAPAGADRAPRTVVR